MRIVLISTPIGFLGSGKGGGVELTLNSLVSGFISLGHSVEVVAPKNSKLHESNVKAKLHFVEGEDQISCGGVWLDERLTIVQWIGVVFVLISVFFVSQRKSLWENKFSDTTI